MIEIFLLAGRVLLVACLFLFLVMVVRSGLSSVNLSRAKAPWVISLKEGPSSLSGLMLAISGPIVIGRAQGSDIVVDDSFVSARHARITPLADNLFIEDLGSTNGTLVNGSRLAANLMLQSGDLIGIGDAIFEVSRDE